jgi:hypothetical protein
MKLWGGLKWKEWTYLEDTVDGVADESHASADLSLLLVLSEPHAEADVVSVTLFLVLLHDLHLNAHVREILGDGTAGSLNSHNSGLD